MLFSGFIFGLVTSFHCIGMCGPIAFMLPVDRQNTSKKVLQIALYHFGRLLAYAIIGLVFGLIGKGLYIFGIQQQLSIIIGVIMIIAVLIPYNTFSKYNFSKPIFRFISKIKTALGKELKKKTPDTFLTIGFLNGFLPCGMVYIAVFAAIALANTLQSVLYMLLFGLGTVPLMTVAIYVSRFLTGKTRQYINKAIPIIVIIIGVLFILRGLELGILYISPMPPVEAADGSIECH